MSNVSNILNINDYLTPAELDEKFQFLQTVGELHGR